MDSSRETTETTNGNGIPDMTKASNGSPTSPTTEKAARGRYRHLALVHQGQRTSCLSHDSENSPSFVGFRNLMVIVLSKQSSTNLLSTFAFAWSLSKGCN